MERRGRSKRRRALPSCPRWWIAKTSRSRSIERDHVSNGLHHRTPQPPAPVILWAGQRAFPIYALNMCAQLVFSFVMTQIHTHHVVADPGKNVPQNAADRVRFRFQQPDHFGDHLAGHVCGVARRRHGAAARLRRFHFEGGTFWPRLFAGCYPSAAPWFAPLFFAHRLPDPKSRAFGCCGRSLAFGVATIGFGLSRWFWLSFLMLFLCGLVDNISVVIRHTLVQLLTPDEKRGRVSSVNNLLIGTSNELGEFESATVAQLLGPAIGNSNALGAVLSVVLGALEPSAWSSPSA